MAWLLGSKESACNAGDEGSIPNGEDPLEEGMAIHFSILAWEIPWTEKPGGLWSMDHKELDMAKACMRLRTLQNIEFSYLYAFVDLSIGMPFPTIASNQTPIYSLQPLRQTFFFSSPFLHLFHIFSWKSSFLFLTLRSEMLLPIIAILSNSANWSWKNAFIEQDLSLRKSWQMRTKWIIL